MSKKRRPPRRYQRKAIDEPGLYDVKLHDGEDKLCDKRRIQVIYTSEGLIYYDCPEDLACGSKVTLEWVDDINDEFIVYQRWLGPPTGHLEGHAA
jgi:hypothetical protein